MTKEEFNSLDILKQIDYINSNLETRCTITNICKDIGIGRSTIRDRFEKVGYKYNAEVKQYQSYVEIVDTDCSNNVVEADNNYNYEDLVKIIQNYNNLNNKMEEVYGWYKLQSSNDVVEPNKFRIKEFKGEAVARSFKLYDPVQKEFAKFCKKNNKYKVQDILSTLLYEAMEKYK